MISKKNIFLGIVIVLVFAIASCSKTSAPVTPAKKAPVVYVVGNLNSRGGVVGAYWKNGVKIALSDTTSAAASISTVTGIAVSDTDVYMAGSINFKAVYWKNGKPVTVGGFSSSANGIAVSGTDVYVVGEDFQNGAAPVYWKNGTEVTLRSPAGYYADGIAVSGADVYVAGNKLGGDSIAYWKNGVFATVANSPSSYSTYGNNYAENGWVNIAVSGSDVYITGATPGFLTATYWKNGTPVYQLNHPTQTSVLNAITINGADIYVAGFYNFNGAYWKNGTLTTLAGGAGLYPEASAITVVGTDVYLAGFSGYPIATPLYWKNGVISILPGSVVNTTGIAVVQY